MLSNNIDRTPEGVLTFAGYDVTQLAKEYGYHGLYATYPSYSLLCTKVSINFNYQLFSFK